MTVAKNEKELLTSDVEKIETQVDASLKVLEDGLKHLEKKYLDATMFTGNIVNGWDGYADSKLRSQTNSTTVNKRDKRNRTKEYYFSKSSYSYTLESNKLKILADDERKKKKKK